MELRFYLRMFQRGWWLILTSMLVATVSSLAYSYYYVTPMYETEARFIVSPNILDSADVREFTDSLDTLDKRSVVATYAEIINSNQIFNGNLALFDLTPELFVDYTTSVVLLPEASIIQLQVQGPNPEGVAFLANSIGQYSIDFVKGLYKIYDLSFIDRAEVPLEPYKPQPLQDVILALVIGGAVGLFLAILRDQLASSFERLSSRRMTDGESGAFSRLYFERSLRNEISKQPAGVLSLGFVYLNGLIEIYDSLPQAYKNQIMRRVTDTLTYQLRGNDMVGRWSQLGFAVLLPTTAGSPAARTLGRIRTILAQPLSLDPGSEVIVELDPRVGVSSYKEGETFGNLVTKAEQALELARQSEEKIFLEEN